MRRTLITTLMLLLCAVWATAQQSYPSSSSNQSGQTSSQTQNNQSNAANRTQVRGCLSGSNGNFTLTADSGQKYQLSGDTSKLSAHVGHEVEITGTTETAQARNPSSGAVAGQESGTAQQTLNVTKLRHISTTCNQSSGTTPPPSGATPPPQ